MPRSDEAAAFFHAVYSAVQEIPPGKVTTYGRIAELVGFPQRPRQVGVCLKHLPEDPEARFNHDNVPWQRVINAKGIISPRYVLLCVGTWFVGHVLRLIGGFRSQPSGARTQAEALRAEGVEVSTSAMGELMVDFNEYGWFPDELPSEQET
ncbi:hypothetical protein RB594_007857 [Gaeumannomyces avenae]